MGALPGIKPTTFLLWGHHSKKVMFVFLKIKKVVEFIDFHVDASVTSCTSDLSVKTIFVTYELLC